MPLRVARELRAFPADAALVQGVHEAAAFLLGRRLAGARTKLILDVQGDWHEATRLYGSPLRRLLNPVNDALPRLVVPRAAAVRTVSTQTTGLVRALGVEPAAVFPLLRRRRGVPRPPAGAAAGDAARGVRRRARAVQGARHARRGVAPRRTARAGSGRSTSSGTGPLRDRVAALVEELPAQTEWSRRLDADEVSRAMDAAWLVCLPSRSEGLPRVALEGAARGRAIVGGDRAGIPDVVHDGENGLLVDPDDADALAGALVRILSDRAEAERLGAAARRTGEEWVITPEQYARAGRAARAVRRRRLTWLHAGAARAGQAGC